LGVALAALGAAAPVNDNFANAQFISGSWGTTNVDTSAATAEPGEPAHAGSAASHSVWYRFVAIQDGTVTMHTFGSPTSNTRLAVYSVAANTNATVNGPLFPVAANDNLDLRVDKARVGMVGLNGPVSTGPSLVTFPVQQGGTYYVALDSTGAGGPMQLTWGYNFGGLFYFLRPQYVSRKTEPMQIAVGRVGGFSGRVLVDVVTTNYTGANTPAVAGTDYIATRQTLTFDDFETLRYATVTTLLAPPPVPTDPTNAAPANPNVYFGLQIVNVRFDPQENTNLLAPPVVFPGLGTSVGRELEPNVLNGFGDPGPTVPPFAVFTNVINFAVAHKTTTEWIGDGDGNVHISLTRTGLGDPSQSVSVEWAINSTTTWGNLENNSFQLWPESDYATPNPQTTCPPGVGPPDFGAPTSPPLSGTVSWAAGDFLPKSIVIPINDDTLVEFNEDFLVQIRNPSSQSAVGEVSSCLVTILYDFHDQPAGSLERLWNNHQQPANNPLPGANAQIFALAVQPDGGAVIGGAFTSYNSFLVNRIARVNVDGTYDVSFNPGNGADGLVTSLDLQPDGNILMGGDFHSVNGFNRYGVARITPSGSVDTTFNPGVGADSTVWSLALSTNGSVVIGGQFGVVDFYVRDHVARLDSKGNVDLSFDTSTLGLDGTVWAVAPQPDGKVLIGGDFTTVAGVPRSRIARLNADGSLDTTFDPGLGANNTVYTILVQPDGNLLVGGAFSQFHTAAHHGLTRLSPSGTLDPSFSPGSSANDIVRSVLYSPSDSMIYVGGAFTAFNSTRRVGLARLFPDGTVDTGFLDTAYNHFAGFVNPLFNPDLYPHNVVYAIGLVPVTIPNPATNIDVVDVLVGGSFDIVGGGGDWALIDPATRRARDHRENLALLRGGSTLGPGNITLTYPNGSGLNNVDKNAGFLQLTLTRTNGTLGSIATRFSPDPLPIGPGAAIYGQDYTYDPINFGLPSYGSTWGACGGQDTRMLSDGIWWRNFPDPLTTVPNVPNPPTFVPALVTIVNNTTASGNRNYNLNLTIPRQADSFFLGGANIPLGTALGPQPSTPSAIIDNRNPPGTFTFITTNYTVSETAGNASITVIRTNGSSDTVTLQYMTFDIPGTPPAGIGYARSNINYYISGGTLTFYPGITNVSFNVGIRNDGKVDPDLALLLVITNIVAQHPQNGTPLGGITNAWLTIIDGNFPQGRLNFSVASFATNEDAGSATITVTRTGGSQGLMSVLCSTTNTVAGPNNTPAVPGVNYTPVTNVMLSWTNGDSSPKSFTIPLLHDFQVTSNLTVGLQLSTPVLNNSVTNYLALGSLSNATLTILNVDHPGFLSFSSPTYTQNESGGYAIIPVVRQGGSIGTVTASFSAASGVNVTPGVEFVPTNGTLTFRPGEVSKVFTVTLIDGQHVDLSNRAIALQLTAAPGLLTAPSNAVLNILSDGNFLPPGGADPTFHAVFDAAVDAVALQPNGAIVVGGAFTVADGVTRHRLARVNADGSLDYTFASRPGGADDVVRGLALQSDGRVLIVGDFLNYDGSSRNHFARVNLDGSLDWQFDPGSALNQSAYTVVETFTDTNRTTRKVLVGGNFTLANGAPRRFLAQFSDNGSVDLGLNADNGAGGINGAVWAIAVQGDHKIIIGGDFTSINGVPRNHIARLNADGSLDNSFNNPGTGASDSVRALALQLDGSILAGGLFTSFNSTPQSRIVRLNADGSLDTTFNTGAGADGAVYTIAVQPDNRILLGGAFTRYAGVTRNHVTRLNPDGSVDTTINFGAGCNNYVASMFVQPDDSIVLGGAFTTYDNASAPYLTRIFGRSIAGSGTFEFASATFGANETATNAVVTLRRQGGTSGTATGPNVSVVVSTSDGYPPNGATNGVNYVGGVFTNVFPPGETFSTILIPMVHDFQVTPDLGVNLTITDVQPLSFAGFGNQPIATLWVSNVDSAVHFSSPSYSIDKSAQEGKATIPIYRFGSTIGQAQVQFMTTGGTAQPNGRYVPVITNVFFATGQMTQNVFIPIINDNQVLGDQTVTMALSTPTNTLLAAPAAATLTIRETSTAIGTLAFSAPSYVFSERAGKAVINVVRANGITGRVTVDYRTVDGTAASGVNYFSTNGTLIFADSDPGQAVQTIAVPLINNPNVTGNTIFSVVLSNATGGATVIGPTQVPVTVVDENVGVSFVAPIAQVSENAHTLSVPVFRQNGTNLTTTVQYSTTNLTAVAGVNYVGVINGSLTFNPGETVKPIVLNILNDPNVTGPLQFQVNLFNPVNTSSPTVPVQVFNYGSAVINVLDVDTGFTFSTTNRVVVTNPDLSSVTNASYGVLKSGTNLLVTILRSNANTGDAFVNYTTTTNAGDTAIAGVDYGFTSGILTFSNNVQFQSFVVPIFGNRLIEGNRSFSINLFSPSSGAQLLPPTTASVTITDDVSSVSFSSSDYRAPEDGGPTSITVVRGNYTNSVVKVDYGTASLTAVPGVNYSNVNGTITFAPGQTVTNFVVPVQSDRVLNGDTTVSLLLSNLVGNAVFVTPSAATLTILETDGSQIVNAGAALVAESGPVNGVIDPGETVTLLFALRNKLGTNTVNLQATLLATNGITNPKAGTSTTPAVNNYGVLVTHGPSASRPFTFTASGTNGQTINATFQVQDGTTDLGQVLFTFTLGQGGGRFINTGAITIRDNTSATPYPSKINVSGLGGVVSKATVTLSNLFHTWPSDVDVLLVSPLGQKSYLMSHAGSSFEVDGTTLTFDDAAGSLLPQFSQIVSGTYRPTCYAAVTPPFPPDLTPPAPYSTNMSAFNGKDPTGDWALYVLDDMAGNSGIISNGWSLSLATAAVVSPAADVALAMSASALTNIVNSNLTFTIALTNYGPWFASNIVVTNFVPAGMAYVGNSPSTGTTTNSSGLFTWTVPSLGTNAATAWATCSLTLQPTNTGLFTNIAGVVTNAGTVNPDDKVASLAVFVVPPIADLSISLADSPDPVMLNNNLTYSFTVSNLGPATATGVVASNTLPNTVSFVSASPGGANYTTKYNASGQLVVTFTNIGSLPSGGRTNLTVVVKTQGAGTISDTVGCRSDVTDPLKANNAATVKTIVQGVPLPLSVTQVNGALAVSWPAYGGYFLENTFDLEPPAIWAPVTDATLVVTNGQIVAVLPIAPYNRFFRLNCCSQ
jgi:uncharacterized delta-60 repeat protein/uncharacterized repeat protein (TIGR01451 family)